MARDKVASWKRVRGLRPWKNPTVEWLIEGEKKNGVKAENRRLAGERLRKIGSVDLVVFSDGSVVEGVSDGGAGVVITKGCVTEPETLAEIRLAAAK